MWDESLGDLGSKDTTEGACCMTGIARQIDLVRFKGKKSPSSSTSGKTPRLNLRAEYCKAETNGCLIVAEGGF
jgi:hypothetical protein